jgi:hypothetical protein
MRVVAVRARVCTVRQPVPRSVSGDGIADGVISIGEGLAGGIIGAGQPVELIPFAAPQGGCALVGVGDDAGGACRERRRKVVGSQAVQRDRTEWGRQDNTYV